MIITKRYATCRDSFTGIRLTVYTNAMNGNNAAFYVDDISKGDLAALESLTGDDKIRFEKIKAKCRKDDGNIDIVDNTAIKGPVPIKVLFPFWSSNRIYL